MELQEVLKNMQDVFLFSFKFLAARLLFKSPEGSLAEIMISNIRDCDFLLHELQSPLLD